MYCPTSQLLMRATISDIVYVLFELQSIMCTHLRSAFLEVCMVSLGFGGRGKLLIMELFVWGVQMSNKDYLRAEVFYFIVNHVQIVQ